MSKLTLNYLLIHCDFQQSLNCLYLNMSTIRVAFVSVNPFVSSRMFCWNQDRPRKKNWILIWLPGQILDKFISTLYEQLFYMLLINWYRHSWFLRQSSHFMDSYFMVMRLIQICFLSSFYTNEKLKIHGLNHPPHRTIKYIPPIDLINRKI